ncbi:hypothetical protein [Streptomyces sp. NPDC050121]|uniref:hypothetical protein n=1 Tax=Streptomyces sp. NPDC050121 TaxID=3365601 RepID=UPI0037928864
MLVVAGILAAVSGCAPAATSGGQERPADIPLPGQAWALKDGVVTAEEYRAAVDRFISCVRDAGYAVDDPVRSPVDNLTLIYDIKPSGKPDVYNEAVQACNLSHLSLVEPTFVESEQQVMDEVLRTAVTDCLRRQGVSLTGKERSLKDYSASAKDEVPVVDCVTEEWPTAYPDLPATVPIRF